MTAYFRALLADLTSRLEAARDGWNGFWFRPADPLLLGVLRVGTGLTLLWLLVVSGPLLPSLYGPEAWVDQKTANWMREETPFVPPPQTWEPTAEERPLMSEEELRHEREGFAYNPELNVGPKVDEYARRWNVLPGNAYTHGLAQFSPFFHLKTPAGMWAAHALAIVVALLYTLGVGTRVTAVLAWVVGLSYVHRVSSALFGMDTMLAILLLYLAIGPSGAALSLDRWLADRRQRALGLPEEGPQPSVMAGLALRLLQVHFCFIYLASGCSKLQGNAWWNGTAIWQTLANYEFTPRPEWHTAFLRFLVSDRWIWELFHSGGTLFTLALELGLPFLIWQRRWRGPLILGPVLLHTGISLTMGLHSFSVLMILMSLSFVDPAWLRGLFVRRPAAAREEAAAVASGERPHVSAPRAVAAR